MWATFPLALKRMALAAYAFVVSFLMPAFLGQRVDDAPVLDILAASWSTATVGILIAWLVGKWGWRLLWRTNRLGMYLDTHLCPNLRGVWRGELFSSYDNFQKATEVTATIKADLFGIMMTLSSPRAGLRSNTTCFRLAKDADSGMFRVYYQYDATTDHPVAGDSQQHQGSARLDVVYEDGKIQCLKGVYWTNRQWQESNQTAGSVTFTRVS